MGRRDRRSRRHDDRRSRYRRRARAGARGRGSGRAPARLGLRGARRRTRCSLPGGSRRASGCSPQVDHIEVAGALAAAQMVAAAGEHPGAFRHVATMGSLAAERRRATLVYSRLGTDLGVGERNSRSAVSSWSPARSHVRSSTNPRARAPSPPRLAVVEAAAPARRRSRRGGAPPARTSSPDAPSADATLSPSSSTTGRPVAIISCATSEWVVSENTTPDARPPVELGQLARRAHAEVLDAATARPRRRLEPNSDDAHARAAARTAWRARRAPARPPAARSPGARRRRPGPARAAPRPRTGTCRGRCRTRTSAPRARTRSREDVRHPGRVGDARGSPSGRSPRPRSTRPRSRRTAARRPGRGRPSRGSRAGRARGQAVHHSVAIADVGAESSRRGRGTPAPRSGTKCSRISSRSSPPARRSQCSNGSNT